MEASKTALNVAAKRDRDSEALKRRCFPLKLGMALILLVNLAMSFQIVSNPQNLAVQLVGLAVMYLASLFTLGMLYSFCERNNQTAAWVTVVFSPLVIAMFAYQIEMILVGFLA